MQRFYLVDLTLDVVFATSEILDRPGTFLDFSKPETLDDQLAEVYGLTERERERTYEERFETLERQG